MPDLPRKKHKADLPEIGLVPEWAQTGYGSGSNLCVARHISGGVQFESTVVKRISTYGGTFTHDETKHEAYLAVAQRIAAAYGAHPAVVAVALGGSLASGVADAASDIDLYVYLDGPLSLTERAAVAGDTWRAEIGNTFWEPGDEWIDAAAGIHLDVMFRDVAWIEADLARVLDRREAWVGYSTAFWHNVRASRPLVDPREWYAALKTRASAPYPEALVRAIVAKNHPILRDTLSSYRYQLQRALERADRVSLNHRVAAVLASVFDILFALNHQPHPGEKRVLALTETLCPRRPPEFAAQVDALLAASADANPALLDHLDALCDGLDALLREEGLLA